MKWERRSRILIVSTAFLAAVILSEMILYVGRFFYGGTLDFNLFQHCSSFLISHGLGWMIPVLDVLVLYTLAMASWHIFQQMYQFYRAYRKITTLVHEKLTASLNDKFCRSKRRDVLVIRHQEPIALTMGFFRPKIIVSTGLLDILHHDELASVIRHEIFHRISRDPLKSAFMNVCSKILWYIPILKWSYAQYQTAREILADAYAIQATGSSISLGSALLKMMKQNQTRTYSFTYASFAECSINYRLQQLIDPETKLSLKVPLKRVLISLLTAAAIFILLLASLH